MLPSISLVKVTPFASKVEISLFSVDAFALIMPVKFSNLRMVCNDTPDLVASSSCFQARKILADLICAAVNFSSCISQNLVLISKKIVTTTNFRVAITVYGSFLNIPSESHLSNDMRGCFV